MILIDFENDFAEFFITYDVTRFSAGSDNSEGEWVSGSTTQIEIVGMPTQPLSSTEQKLVQPEDGQYISDFRKIYSTSAFQQKGNGMDADVVLINGNKFEVYEASNRLELGGHFKAIIRKIQGDISS